MAEAPEGEAPLIDVFGGKITTYRRLAEHMLEKIEGFLGPRGAKWTASAPLPGGDFAPDGFEREVASLRAAYPFLEAAHAARLVRLYGTRARVLLGPARAVADLGRHFGADLYEAEIRYLMAHEWAATAEDVLWRRTKRGLRLTAREAAALEDYMRGIARERSTAAE
jgi:glycerol-3-phosphate dehydrogenase